MNSIQAYCGPVRVVVVGPNLVFACEHSVRAFAQAVSLVKDNTSYPATVSYLRFNLDNGAVTEEPNNVFTVQKKVNGVTEDGVFLKTYRSFPAEAVETLARVKVGDKVIVESKVTKTSVEAQVHYIVPESGYIQINYHPPDGDSSSIVRTVSGEFVGFVSARFSINGETKCQVVVPESVPGNVNAPADVAPVPAPTPTPTSSTESAEYQRGFRAGQKQVSVEVFKQLNPLAAGLPDLMTQLTKTIMTN